MVTTSPGVYETAWSSWQLRRGEGQITDDGARYVLADWEWFVPLDDLPEQFLHEAAHSCGLWLSTHHSIEMRGAVHVGAIAQRERRELYNQRPHPQLSREAGFLDRLVGRSPLLPLFRGWSLAAAAHSARPPASRPKAGATRQNAGLRAGGPLRVARRRASEKGRSGLRPADREAAVRARRGPHHPRSRRSEGSAIPGPHRLRTPRVPCVPRMELGC